MGFSETDPRVCQERRFGTTRGVILRYQPGL
jgi:hypothetical protein